MADLWGQYDNNLRGGSDTWNNGTAGEILIADYLVQSSEYTVSPSGISSASVFGSPSVEFHRNLSPFGIPSGEALGVATVSTTFSVVISGIPSGEAFGSPSFSNFNIISPIGIPSGEAFGTNTVEDVYSVVVSSIPSGEAFGNGSVSFQSVLSPTGIPSGEAFGGPAVEFYRNIAVSGIPSSGALGTPVVSVPSTVYDISPSGIVSGEQFGQPVVSSDVPVPVNPATGGGGGPGIYFRPAVHEPKRYPNQVIAEGIPDQSGMGVPTVSYGVATIKPVPKPSPKPVKKPDPILVNASAVSISSEEVVGEPVCGFHFEAVIGPSVDETGVGTPSVKSITEEQARLIKIRNNAIIMAVVAAA